jgi:WD40 repeat protein
MYAIPSLELLNIYFTQVTPFAVECKFSFDSNAVITGGPDGSFMVFRVDTNSHIARMFHGDSGSAETISQHHSGKWIVVGGRGLPVSSYRVSKKSSAQ